MISAAAPAGILAAATLQQGFHFGTYGTLILGLLFWGLFFDPGYVIIKARKACESESIT